MPVKGGGPDGGHRSTVAYIYPYAFKYRNPFHEGLRANLAADGIDYHFIYCSDPKLEASRADLAAPTWATSVRCTSVRIGQSRLRYQHALKMALTYDLVILQQENGLLLNYLVQVLGRVFGVRVAFFGHGRNFQARNLRSLPEKFKRFWIDKVDWWFAYTRLSAQVVEEAGFPADRVTVFNNAIDSTSLVREAGDLDPEKQADLRQSLVAGSANVGIYLGALYADKRVSFLLEAAREIRRQLPDFHLVVVGGGEESTLVEAAAAELDWVHYMGPRFGKEKAELLALGKVMLLPGAVGLAVLDAFALGVPLVTTAAAYHGPEIAYLENGKNGVLTTDDEADYASAAVSLLQDDHRRESLVAEGKAMLATLSIENMVERFAAGVKMALRLT